ncbi:MAG: hypothetical protein H0V89_04255 [Deltaproteobacteria bacterium]|nr:hypothetical protein [Deltaproteobacteria bacterium]
MWWFLAACTLVDETASPPRGDAVIGGDAELADAAPAVPIDELLQQAAEKGAVGDAAAAVEAWREAYAAWEITTEPRVRRECDRCATEIEYAFGRLRAEIAAKGGRPLPLLVDLRGRLERWQPAE